MWTVQFKIFTDKLKLITQEIKMISKKDSAWNKKKCDSNNKITLKDTLCYQDNHNFESNLCTEVKV